MLKLYKNEISIYNIFLNVSTPTTTKKYFVLFIWYIYLSTTTSTIYYTTHNLVIYSRYLQKIHINKKEIRVNSYRVRSLLLAYCCCIYSFVLKIIYIYLFHEKSNIQNHNLNRVLY